MKIISLLSGNYFCIATLRYFSPYYPNWTTLRNHCKCYTGNQGWCLHVLSNYRNISGELVSELTERNIRGFGGAYDLFVDGDILIVTRRMDECVFYYKLQT